jgi:UDP-N-acetylglucosamine/UDP-N-acetylgalactosamine 4-epimerase
MPAAYEMMKADLKRSPSVWLVTGAAGFIGSHLIESLLRLDQRVIGLDNLAFGSEENFSQVRSAVTPEQWRHFEFHKGDICDLNTCQRATRSVDYVLHHAALGSVPASIKDPFATHRVNVTGFMNVLCAARDQRVRRVVYASSSAVYGDDESLPKVEERIGSPLSPYAVTKQVNELYAGNFHRCYGLQSIGLRYFNVFGTRQNPAGPYAAVIPKWIEAMVRGEEVHINGDGETTRDFCHVANVVQANLLAATAKAPEAVNQIYNVALGCRTTLNELFELIRRELQGQFHHLKNFKPTYRDFRPGDVRHSQADIGRAASLLGYAPQVDLQSGLAEAMAWYVGKLSGRVGAPSSTDEIPRGG